MVVRELQNARCWKPRFVPDSSIRHARPQPEHFELRILNRRSSATRGTKTIVLEKKTKSINKREDQYQEDTYGVLINSKNPILKGGSLVLSFLFIYFFFCFFRTSSKSLHWRCSQVRECLDQSLHPNKVIKNYRVFVNKKRVRKHRSLLVKV